jgi:hypothetical protein
MTEDATTEVKKKSKKLTQPKVEGLDVDYVKDVLGYSQKPEKMTEEELEEFIIRKACQELTNARLVLSDSIIFNNVCADVFPKSEVSTGRDEGLYNIIEEKL